ncbi:MAG TPA: methylated-DNA--[protein]-cysteine S-methyltransferase, partial [Terriglobales bacterium]|nr:methylated-DNA--[protein]-cysteine S-methyltransferase [Terriglobales bacterium]
MTPNLHISASARGVSEIQLARGRQDRRLQEETAAVERWRTLARSELSAYFSGRLTEFSSPYDIHQLPRFTRSVLALVARIPYGEVRTYEWVARQLKKPRAARAVGNALGRNPVPILIPCHRVVRSDGTLGGFALGSGWKKKLLALEKS